MKKIANHIQYRFSAYIAVLLVFSVIWCTVFAALKNPKADEKITISYFNKDLEVSALTEELHRVADSLTEQKIKEISVNVIAGEGKGFTTQLIEAKYLTSDICIIATDFFSDAVIKNNFMPLSDKEAEYLKNELGNSVEYHSIDGVVYGIYLTGLSTDNNFSKHYKGEVRLIALPCPDSVNYGSGYGSGEAENTAALEILKYLLSEVTE